MEKRFQFQRYFSVASCINVHINILNFRTRIQLLGMKISFALSAITYCFDTNSYRTCILCLKRPTLRVKWYCDPWCSSTYQLCIPIFVCLSFCLSSCLSVCPVVCLFFYTAVNLSVYFCTRLCHIRMSVYLLKYLLWSNFALERCQNFSICREFAYG